MHIMLRRDWEMEDISQKGKTKVIKAGEHRVDRIQHHNKPWLVIAGTNIGLPEAVVQGWREPKWGDHQIIFKEE